jgi:hypothetical protein
MLRCDLSFSFLGRGVRLRATPATPYPTPTRKVGAEVKKTHSSRPPTRAPTLGGTQIPPSGTNSCGCVGRPYSTGITVVPARSHGFLPSPAPDPPASSTTTGLELALVRAGLDGARAPPCHTRLVLFRTVAAASGDVRRRQT